MTVYVVIVSKEGCSPNCYVYKNKDDAIRLFCYYQNLEIQVMMEDEEVREKYGD